MAKAVPLQMQQGQSHLPHKNSPVRLPKLTRQLELDVRRS